jgi:predicted permease
MRWADKLLLRMRSLFQRPQLERELDDELRFHLGQQIEENIAAGMNPEAAQFAARRTIGGFAQIKEGCRDMRRVNLIQNLLQDLRYAARMLRRSPGFTAVAAMSLALGIGANTAIFSLIDALLLKTLPVRQPEQLVELLTVFGTEPSNAFSYPALQYFRDRNHVLTAVFATSRDRFYTVMEGKEPERVDGQYATGNFFEALGVSPILGRTIIPEDDRSGNANVAVISYGYWQRRFALDPHVLGKRITVENIPCTIVGVTPPEFFGVQVGSRTDLWIPLSTAMMRDPSFANSAASKWLQLMGRLKPGVSLERARADLAVIFQQAVIGEELALNNEPAAKRRILTWRLQLEKAGSGLSALRRQFSRPLVVLMGIVGLVLLIACANVANLLLARATTRQKEIAVRMALGASRSRLICQLMTESLLLAIIGGALGVILAWWGSNYLVAFMATGRRPILLSISPDTGMLLFTTAVSLLTGILFGIAPAFRSARTDLTPALKAAARTTQSRRVRRSVGKVLVVSQVAVSLVLLVGAGLFMRTLRNLHSINLGFEREHVLLVSVDPARSGYTPEQLTSRFKQLLERFESTPGVRSASLSWITPITGGGTMLSVSVEGYMAKHEENREVYLNWIAPKYFETLGTPLVIGRDFGPQDTMKSPRVGIINQTLARHYFGSRNPIGKHVTIDPDAVKEIIGVVGDAKYLEVREATPPTMYLDSLQEERPGTEFEIRTAGNPAGVISAVRREMEAVVKGVPIADVRTLESQVDASIVQERLIAMLSGFFGGLALLLACIGLHGIMAYTVARRTSEIGIRMALGAERAQVLWMILREVLLLMLIGVGIGLPVVFVVARLTASLLFGLKPTDPTTITAAVVVMSAVAAVAGYLPARRASRVDPMVALRYE